MKPILLIAIALLAGNAQADPEQFVRLADGNYEATGMLDPPRVGPIIWEIEVVDGKMRYRAKGVMLWSAWFSYADESQAYIGINDGWAGIWTFGDAGTYQHSVIGAGGDSGSYVRL